MRLRSGCAVIAPVILCGGAGARLWPLSNAERPKPFLPLFGGRSTFQQTLLRVHAPGFAPPLVVAGARYRALVMAQAGEIGVPVRMVAEPEARNSGPALAAAAVWLEANEPPDAVMLALAADHLVRDAAGFREACQAALPAAKAGRIVTFGVTPTSASTDYGYIARSDELAEAPGVFAVARFVEKPDAATAARFVAAGLVWNSGNFLTRADALLAEYAAFEPETIAAVREAVGKARDDDGTAHLDAASFAGASRQAIDRAVMERTKRAAVLPARFDWCDIGNWGALIDAAPTDASGNAVLSDGPAVGLAGVSDLAVVAANGRVFVVPRKRPELMAEIASASNTAEETGPSDA